MAAVLAAIAVVLVVFLVLRRHENDAFSFSGTPTDVVIDSSAGLVVIVPAEGNQVQVSQRARWTLFKPDTDVKIEGGSLLISADCIGPSFICEVQYRVSVPSTVAVRVTGGAGDVQLQGIGGNVDVQTSSGDVTATDVTSDLKVRTSSGDVSVSNVSGGIDLATDSGSISGTAIDSATVQTGTSSGDISLTVTGATNRVAAGSGSGDIALVVPDVPYAVEAQSSSGDVNVDVTEASDATRTITANTGAGQISITRG